MNKIIKMKTTIAVCGKANAGKTSFITTLRRDHSGTIQDKNNTTEHIEDYPHSILEIILSDFPGFEKMDGVETYLNLEKNDPEYAIKNKNLLLVDIFSQREYEFLSEIKKRDLVFLVCSIESTPLASHETEIKLIQQVNPNIIAIISKTGNLEKRHRIEDWKFVLERRGITDVVEFDAHFTDDRNIVVLMNHCIKFIKSPEKLKTLKESINLFEENCNKKYSEIRKSFVELMKSLYKTNTYSKDESGLDNYFKEIITSDINKGFEKYLKNITSALDLDLEELKDLSKKIYVNVSYEEKKFDNEGRKIGLAAGLIGGIAALALGPIGWIGFFVGDIAGAAIGDKIGESMIKERKYTTSISNSELTSLAKYSILTYWLASKIGYARLYGTDKGLKISIEEFKEFEDRIVPIKEIQSIDGISLEKWFDEAILKLEN
jgi:GTP-binding protein EngB required for normal cell division